MQRAAQLSGVGDSEEGALGGGVSCMGCEVAKCGLQAPFETGAQEACMRKRHFAK